MNISYDLEIITPHTAANTTGIGRGNAGGVALNDFIIAIDSTMFPKTGQLLRENLEKEFGLPVKFLLLTHIHGDHVFGTQAFKDTCIFSSTSLARSMPEVARTRWKPEDLEEWKKNQPEMAPLLDGLEFTFPFLGFTEKLEIVNDDLKLECYHCGGHTEGSCYAIFSEEKVLIAGDLIFAKTFPYAGDPSCNPDIWIQQLETFLRMDIEKIIPGHGPIVGKTEIKKHLDFFRELRKVVKDAIDANNDFNAIQVPDFYEDEGGRRKQSALEHWYKFYKNTED